MEPLNDQQFAAHTEARGGGSRRLSDNTLVSDTDPANRGSYAISYPKTMGHETNKPGPVTRDQIHYHAAKMRADPSLTADPGTMQGTWKDPRDARVYRDASRLVGPDAGKDNGRRKSVALGQPDQEAIRDMSRGRDVRMRRRPAVEIFDPTKGETPATHKIVGNRTMGYTVEPRRATSV